MKLMDFVPILILFCHKEEKSDNKNPKDVSRKQINVLLAVAVSQIDSITIKVKSSSAALT